ncbi:hypothetical protein R3P38DRAFT_3206271 [Favolaschia claudopus]|uniref:Uncharacterized protein n=1 Tax=Favolaschia claudopus TaxID=2862362 RepID=A0AAW0ALL4_9AGAR
MDDGIPLTTRRSMKPDPYFQHECILPATPTRDGSAKLRRIAHKEILKLRAIDVQTALMSSPSALLEAVDAVEGQGTDFEVVWMLCLCRHPRKKMNREAPPDGRLAGRVIRSGV